MKSANVVNLFPRATSRRSRQELAFLPAALEIVETPPSPVGRAIGATIILLIVLALAWAAFGTIDIVASAPGKLIPSDRVKVIQPVEIGVVRRLLVEDGQKVAAGDVLIEIDPTINQAEARMLRSDLVATQLDIARLHAALAESGEPLDAFKAPADARPEQVAEQKRFLASQVGEHRSRIAALERQREQKQAEAETLAAQIAKIEAVLPVMQQRYEIRQKLHSAELGSKLQYLEMLQAYTEQQQELLVQKRQQKVAEAAIAAITETRGQAVGEYRRGLFDELGKLNQKANGLAENLTKAEQRTRLQELRAPVDGTVQQLAVHTVGGVVTPSQELMVVVPADSRLEVEAMITNKDIGFVKVGQEAEVKVDTFNFTKYGQIAGRVATVSRDAVARQKPPERAGDKPGSQTGSSEPKGLELNYLARVALDRTTMKIEDELINLSAGMAVTVEIKTGQRTVLSYLLSPIMRFRHESLRER